MKYIDTDGDTWEDVEDSRLQCIASGTSTFTGTALARTVVEEKYGPLRPVADDLAEPDLPTVESVMSRNDIFRSAHALVTGLEWSESDKPSVYDVLSVAKWLEGDE